MDSATEHGKNKNVSDNGNHRSISRGLESKGLKAGAVGLLGAVVIGVSTIAPAYTLTAGLGGTVAEVGKYVPAILLVGFIPMLLVAFGYRELNNEMPDSGTSFTWATKAFGPWLGWMGGWGLVASTIIVLSSLAGIAVEFFFLLLGQIFQNPELGLLYKDNFWNIFATVVFITIACWIAYRGMESTKAVQYVLVIFQVIVLLWFSIAAFNRVAEGVAFDPQAISLDWFNPFAVGPGFAAGVSLSIFLFWGWDTTLTMNEEMKDPKRTPGRAAVLTMLVIISLYLLVSLAVISYAGVGEEGLGAANPENRDNLFVVLAEPIMGPAAILMSLAVLSSSAASLQSTFISPGRTMLAMGYYKALPPLMGTVSPKHKSPVGATITAGVATAIFYAVTRLVSDSALADTVAALGMMICFYYGITALACVWYFRRRWMGSWRMVLFRLVFPLLGGLILLVVFVKTAIDSADPAYASGSEVGGVGLVFILGIGTLLLGVVLMVIMYFRFPAFFRGEVITKGAAGDDDAE